MASMKEIAAAINDHLRRLENDPVFNVRRKFVLDRWVDDPRGEPMFFHAKSYASGNRVLVEYVWYHGASSLTKEAAAKYLAWLDAGNKGKHYRVEDRRSKAKKG